jgi:ribose transport system permease protein
MVLIMLGGGLDLSIGSVAALGAVVAASAITEGQSPQDAFILAMIFTGGVGLLHALLVGAMGLNPVVLTLVTALLVQSSVVLFADGLPVALGQDPGFLESLHNLPILVGSVIGGSLILLQMAMIGGGSGRLPTTQQRWYRRTIFIALPYLLSSLAAGVVGCSMAGRYPLAVPNTDMQMSFMVILAAAIGGNCTGRRFGTIIGAIAGVAILTGAKRLMLMEAVAPERITLIVASAAGAAMLLSQIIYWIMNLLYRKSRRILEA